MNLLLGAWVIAVVSLPMIIAATFHSNPSAEVRWTALAVSIGLVVLSLFFIGSGSGWEFAIVAPSIAPPLVLAAVWMGLGHLRRLYKEGAEAERDTASPQE